MSAALLRAALCALLVALAGPSRAAAPEPPQGLIALDGRPAPELKLRDMDGSPADLGELRGRWVLVHFWASWCGPCRREMPTLSKMLRLLPPERLSLLLVNTAETDDEVFAFLGTVGMDLVPLMDRDGLVTKRWQPRGLPSTFIVDPDGRLRYLALGGRDWASKPYLEFLRALAGR